MLSLKRSQSGDILRRFCFTTWFFHNDWQPIGTMNISICVYIQDWSSSYFWIFPRICVSVNQPWSSAVAVANDVILTSLFTFSLTVQLRPFQTYFNGSSADLATFSRCEQGKWWMVSLSCRPTASHSRWNSSSAWTSPQPLPWIR